MLTEQKGDVYGLEHEKRRGSGVVLSPSDVTKVVSMWEPLPFQMDTHIMAKLQRPA
jgi:hypothetical protein